MTPNVLNPALYHRLELLFGRDQVEACNPGQAIVWETRWELPPIGSSDTRRIPRRHIVDPGEEYRVRCELCRDHRPRLHINHRWGVQDDETQTKNLWLINCFNENCYSDYDARRRLYERVWGIPLSQLRRRGQTSRDVRRGVVADRPRNELCEMPSPGPTLRLDVLQERFPNHHAIKYLQGRGFDPAKLGSFWGVGYCLSSKFRLATDRIFIPIRQQGMMVGWQTRYVGDDVEGRSFNEAGISKYWTSPSMPRRLVAYNIERALQHSTLIIVEGPADCWNVGPMATALLGTKAGDHVLGMIAAGMKRHGDRGVIVVALDPQLPRRKNPKPCEHPIQELTAKLGKVFPAERVVPLYLPNEYDPGSIDRRWFRQLARDAAAQRGLTLDFSRPRPVAAVQIPPTLTTLERT